MVTGTSGKEDSVVTSGVEVLDVKTCNINSHKGVFLIRNNLNITVYTHYTYFTLISEACFQSCYVNEHNKATHPFVSC